MPMEKSDAERALQLLWEFLENTDEDDLDQQRAYKEVIGGLHSYLSDVLPASLPCLRAKGANGLVIEIQPEPNARPQTIDIYCNSGEKLGIVLDRVNLNGRLWSASDQISPIMVSLITPGSAAAKDGRLARGDQILEIDGHPLSQCSVERARWLMDRAERFRSTHLTVITSGLSEGLKHSESRDFLATLPRQQKKSKSFESLSRILQSEVVITAEVHGQEDKRSKLRGLSGPGPPRSKRQSSARSSHSSSFRNHPAYAPSIGSRHDSNASLVSSTVETAAYLARTSFRRREAPGGGFKKRKVRKMHIMKGDSGLGLRIVGGKGSKFGDMGIFVNKLEEGGAAFKDNRLHPGDELLMVNGKSLVGLTHNEAVDALKSTQKLVQLVVATESTEGDSVASSLQSIPEAVAARRAYYNPQVRSFSPLSIESSSSGLAMVMGPELQQQLPERNTFHKESSNSGLELQLKMDPSLYPAASNSTVEAETKFSSREGRISEELASPMERSDQFEVIHTITPWARTTPHKTPPPPEPDIKTIVYVKTEGKSLGFSICGGKGSQRGDIGILVRNIDPEGLAAQDGRLRRGDEILDVNGKSLQGCTHKKAASIIRSMKTGVVTLTIQTGNGKLQQGNTIKRSSLGSGSEVEVMLIKKAGKPLGLQLADVKRDDHQSAVVVKKIAPNSPASDCTDLKCDDQVVAVNDTSMANLRTDKVRAFLSSLPPGEVKLTLVRQRDIVQAAVETQESDKYRSTTMGQANTSSSSKSAAPTVARVTVSQATPISAEDISESDSAFEEDDTAPEVPVAPPPIVRDDEETGMDHDDDEEMRPRLRTVIQQAQPSRPESALLTIEGSLSVFGGHQEESNRQEEAVEEDEEGMDVPKLPPPPPSPPASDISDEREGEDDPPMVPVTAPPPLPDNSTFPGIENKFPSELPPLPTGGVPGGLPTLPGGEDGLKGEKEMFAPPITSPLPVSEDSSDFISPESLPALPTSRPPLISDDTTEQNDLPLLTSKPLQIPGDAIEHNDLPPPAPPTSKPPMISYDLMFNPLEQLPSLSARLSSEAEGSSCPPGYVQLEIDLKKRANNELGVTVMSSGEPTSDLFMIRRIKAAGAAAKDGRLRPGDRLVAVNGKGLSGLNHAAILQKLNDAPKDCRLTIWRDPSLDSSANATTPTFSGSRTSLVAASDEEEEGLARRRSLSNLSLDNSPLAVAKKLSVGKGISPRGSPLAHTRLSIAAAHVNGSPLSKRWSSEDVPLLGPAGEPLDLSPPPISFPPVDQSPMRRMRESTQKDEEFVNVIPTESSPTVTPPQSPSTPTTGTPPQPSSTPPPPCPKAPPPTMERGLKLDMTAVAAAMRMTADDISSDESANEEAPPPLPQTLPPTTKELPPTEEAPPPLPQTTPLTTTMDDSAERLHTHPLPQTTPTSTKGVESDVIKRTMENEVANETKEVERPKSLGPVPKGQRLEDAPFEIEISKSLLGGLGLTVCENELGMIVVKALTTRSPITKDGNIRVGDHLISVNDENLLGKRLAEAEGIIKSLPRGPVRIVAMAPPRNVTNGGIRELTESSKSTPSTSAPSTSASISSKPLSGGVSEVHSTTPSSQETVDEEGIVRVLLQRYGGRPLGFTIEGGSDTDLKYVYIQSLSIGSPASNSGLFVRGDQLVMVGDHCLIGVTNQEAKRILDTAPNSVEIVAQRKQSPKQVPKNSILETHTSQGSQSNSYSRLGTDIPNTTSTNSTPQVKVSAAVDDRPVPHTTDKSSRVVTEEAPPTVMMIPEERLTVQLLRMGGERLGLTIGGGTDNPNLPQVHVKKVLPEGVAGRTGQLKRGDRIISVNGNSLERASNKMATELLRNAGDHVILVIARKIGRHVSTATTPFESRVTSRRGSGDTSRQGSKKSSPQPSKRFLKPPSSSGETSQDESRGQTPPISTRRHNRRQSLGQSGEVLAFRERSTLPRKVGSKVGVRLVELHKGPTGLGMQIQGGKDRHTPITVKMVISGGVAHKSGKIHPGDVIIEANSISFENLTHAEALKTLKGFPQGQVSLIIRDRTAVAHTRT